MCFMVSLGNTCFLFGGLDATLHLAEEAESPRKSVPRAMVCTVLIGFTTAFCFSVALLYGIYDMDAVLSATG